MATGAAIANLPQFQQSLRNAASELNAEQVPAFLKKVVLDAYRGYVMGTRVDTGRARGGWTISKGAPKFDRSGRTDKSGAAVLSEGVSTLTGITADSIIYVNNGVVYIAKLEDLDHMVENTNRRLQNKIASGTL